MSHLFKNIFLLLILFIGMSCNKLTTTNQVSPIVFKGLKSIDTSSKGTAILLWDRPRGAAVAGFEVYVQDLSTATETVAMKLDDETEQSAPIILTDIADGTSPSKLGKLVQVIASDTNSFEIPTLLPGRYAIQVKAVGADGALDTNTKVGVIRVESTLGYPGILKAEVQGTDVYLEWPVLQTTLTSRKVIYTIYEGATFQNAKAITDQTAYKLSLLGYRAGTVLYYGVRSTDAKGRADKNIKTIAITVPSAEEAYPGCVTGEARGSDRINIKFAWPEESFDAMKIYRDGNLVYTTRDRGVTDFLDLGLQEGDLYTYTCVATLGSRAVTGKTALKLTTLSSNPPTFRGITGVDLTSAHSAIVKWGVSSGVPVDSFWIYATVGSTVDWSADPIAKVTADKLDYQVTGLGDELNYSFGVRACSIKTICDFNEVKLSAQTVDDGKPLTVGATALVVADAKLKITAPWQAPQGGMSKRLVYLKTNGLASTLLSDYTLVATIPVTNSASPPVELLYSPIVDNTTYHVIVIDQDSLNQKTSGNAPVSLFSGDTNKPIFNGLTGLLVGQTGFEETTLQMKFVPIDAEPASPTGATSYVAMVAVGVADACALTVPKQTYAAIDYTAGQETTVTLTGLDPQTVYSVCLKARDLAGNLSDNSLTSTRSTLDKTAPGFDGIQSLAYDKEKGVLVLGWNPSTASDLFEYTIKLWKNDPNPDGVASLTIKKRSTEAANGVSINQSTFAVASLENVYALVSACDNAGAIPGGAQNCSTHAYTTAKVLTLADIDPPPGFLGVEAEPMLGATVEGQIVVKWIAPTSWTDYRGFKVYYIDPITSDIDSVAKDCACSGENCPDQITQCTLTNLDPFRTYRLHVRAYDKFGNTTILDPSSYSTNKRTKDSTPPVFNSALQLTFAEAKIALSWAPATDNQYALEEGADIFYEIYRKKTSNFDNPNAPYNDAQMAMMDRTSSKVGTNWVDTGKDFVSGATYFYTICAVDGSGNRSCDGNVKNFLIPDLVPPVITAFTTTKTDDSYEWRLNWTASDNVTAASALLFKVYAKNSTLAEDEATVRDTAVYINNGTPVYDNVRGPINTDTYIHYLLVVEDADGNKATKKLSVYSQNKVTLSTVRSTEGLIAGGTKIVLVGEGFKPDLQIKIGTSDCQNITRYSSRHAICKTPAGTTGTYNVKVVGPDGSSGELANAYSYCSGTSCQNICNRSGDWTGSFAKGTGIETDPYIICNLAHLNAIRTVPFAKWFKMGENISLQGQSFLPLYNSNGSSKEFQGKFDGDNFVISDWTFNNINAADGVGLFGVINLSVVKNLGLINFDITAKNYVGALAGGASVTNSNLDSGYYSWNNTISGIFVTAKVKGGYRVGGLIGHSGAIVNSILAYTDVEGSYQVGGIFGRKYDGASKLEHHGAVIASGSGSSDCNVGGIGGYWPAYSFSLSDAKNYGSVTCTDVGASNVQKTGGIAGHIGDVTGDNLHNYATINGKHYTAGIFGICDRCTLSNISNHGSITGVSVVAGLVGQNYYSPLLSAGKNEGNVTGTGDSVAGIIGRNYAAGSGASRAVVELVINKATILATNNLAGGIIGLAENVDVKKATNEGAVTGSYENGGIVSYARFITINESVNTGNITSISGGSTGGIAGAVSADYGMTTITKNQSSGAINGSDDTGGCVGLMRGVVSECEFNGDVTGIGRVGGVVGRMEPGTTSLTYLVEKSKATGTVTGDNKCGGIIGEIKDYTNFKKNAANTDTSCLSVSGGAIGWVNGNTLTIEQSSARGTVYGNTPVGGFVGGVYKDSTNAVIIRDCYSRASVKGNDSVGGFAGVSGAILTRVYSTGKVSPDSTDSRLGGLVGLQYNTGTAVASFWDKTNSNQASSALGEGKTTSLMLGSSLYSSYDLAVWSFSSLDYPKLLWEVAP